LVRRLRRSTAVAAITGAVFASLVGGSLGRAAGASLSISVVGNHFVDGSGHQIRLLGVNHTSAEYGCVDGFGYDDGHFNSADAAAIASWGANAVRIPLNEDCWLGINGQPNSNQGADPPLTVPGYHRAITKYVADLNAHGIYAILDLHWTAPGKQVALEQQPMPDADHSPAFWSSVASTFKNNHAVVFDLFNEPFDPTDPRSGDDTNPSDKVSWNCWETGTKNGPAGGSPCYTAAYDENNTKTTRYRIAGMQTLLDAIRSTGAKQPFISDGLDYANDLGEHDGGRQWMNHAPDDPLNQEAAGFHNYMGKGCDNAACWKSTIAPIAAHVPVVTGEFDEDNFDEPKCKSKTPSTFDTRYMNWADLAGVSYLAWGWIVESKAEQNADRCSAFFLINNYSKHTPAKPNGVALYDHLRALLSERGSSPKIKITRFSATMPAGGKSVDVKLRATAHCNGKLTGTTIHSYAAADVKRHKFSLGTVYFTLKAHKTRTVVLSLAKPARKLLDAKGKLRVRITVTLMSPHHRRTVAHRTITVKAA
jgi:endoglucanase